MKTSLHPVIPVTILLLLKCGSVNEDPICIVPGGTYGGPLLLAEHSRRGIASPLLVDTTMFHTMRAAAMVNLVPSADAPSVGRRGAILIAECRRGVGYRIG